jgi:hypothetical protein
VLAHGFEPRAVLSDDRERDVLAIYGADQPCGNLDILSAPRLENYGEEVLKPIR